MTMRTSKASYSGSTFSVYDSKAFKTDLVADTGEIYPHFGNLLRGTSCWLTATAEQQTSVRTEPRRPGVPTLCQLAGKRMSAFKNVRENTQVWMSHGDTITAVPDNFKAIASTDEVAIAAYQIEGEEVWGVQFHPEVFHTEDGTQQIA